jgi:hypothetical protein
MRKCVTFRYPAEFVPVSDVDGILAASGAGWFAALLRRVPGLELEESPFQEDWGVVFFAHQDRNRFQIGLSPWEDESWLAHVRHEGFLQRFRRSGRNGLKQLVADVHRTLTDDPATADVAWYDDGMTRPPLPTPFED